ncbi:hypothetical protein F0Q45_03735 [Mycobacterium simiae]|uniref:PPE family protein n=1 Tax=Mycobacterium simiae TaxID=1784 RepID=A0A5B1BUA6_MYCSI|nr:hypothetical protein F0Q45_03735 [Mycobacterium simiae]
MNKSPVENPVGVGCSESSTTAPSSGFFNSGAGSSSGLGNVGSGLSGFWNAVPNASLGGTSGFQNYGPLQSGVLNLGNTISGIGNTGLGLLTAAFKSGFAHLG